MFATLIVTKVLSRPVHRTLSHYGIFILKALALLGIYSLAIAAGEIDTNQVPNSEFRGDWGHTGGNFTGPVPTMWRAVDLGNAEIDVTVVPLAADELYAGSPATNAVRFEVKTFDTAQVFDHSFNLFALTASLTYQAQVYIRADNTDSSNQTGALSVPVFDLDGAYQGREPGSFGFEATDSWQLFLGPAFMELEDTLAHLAFRLSDNGGGSNAILIAMPDVQGKPQANAVPNSEFSGSGGLTDGDVTGTIPDFWRGFAINSSAIDITPVPLAANTLYPGSPATNAIQLTVKRYGGSDGFDHELFRIPIKHGQSYWGEIYLKSADTNGTEQWLTVSMPVFDEQGVFTGRYPGSFVAIAGAQWSLYAGPSFTEVAGHTVDFQLRMSDNGADNSILIAMPRIADIPELVYSDGFETLVNTP